MYFFFFFEFILKLMFNFKLCMSKLLFFLSFIKYSYYNSEFINYKYFFLNDHLFKKIIKRIFN